MDFWDCINNFNHWEFESPDQEDSGRLMGSGFILMVDMIRRFYGREIIINSGYRTGEHNRKVGGKTTSSHLKGLACDIKVESIADRFDLMNAILRVGIRRIGVGSNYMHIDADYTKKQNIIWYYG